MRKSEWGAESNGKLPQLIIPGKTAALIPEFAVEDLPAAELQPWFLRFSEEKNTLVIMMMMCKLSMYFYKFYTILFINIVMSTKVTACYFRGTHRPIKMKDK